MASLNESDAAQYVSDVLRLIEAPMIYQDKVCDIEILNYRGELPCDLLYVLQCRKYRQGWSVQPQSSYTIGFSDFEPMKYATDHFHTALHVAESPDLQPTAASGLDYETTYSIQGDMIYTSFREGMVQMSYKGLVLDEEGYPMIPDNVKVELAIEHYLKYKHYTILWEMGKIADKVLNKAEQEYSWYVGAADTSMRGMSIDQAEAFKAAFTRTILKPLQHHNGFKNLGTQEYINSGSI